MRVITAIVIAHIAALVFGLAGLLIAVPNPHLWADSEFGLRVYQFGMSYAGATHIVLAAIAMLLIGIRYLGLWKTLTFFGIACVVSLSAELIGTTTGFPFGEYSYTSGLGYQILDEVPFSIPLSWFYMGLASFLLASVIARRWRGTARALTAVFLGAALLTIWDLVLDPAMAHESLEVRFWVWFQDGSYYGMPVQNFLGWFTVGALFIGLSRLIWRDGPRLTKNLVRTSYAIYLANMVFAMAISASVGLWTPIAIAFVLGVIPATAALLNAGTGRRDDPDETVSQPVDLSARIARRMMSIGAQFALVRHHQLDLRGGERVPESGPAVLVARHYHHLLDGCALMTAFDRPVRIVVAVDWAKPGVERRFLEFACRLARWPTVIRRPLTDAPRSCDEHERQRYLRRAWRDCVNLLADGEVVVFFPEGYPNVDPHFTPKQGPDDFLPFEAGFARVAAGAQRRRGEAIPMIPVGFDYQEGGDRRITMRVGEPVMLSDYLSVDSLIADMQEQVRSLSRPVPSENPSAARTFSEST